MTQALKHASLVFVIAVLISILIAQELDDRGTSVQSIDAAIGIILSAMVILIILMLANPRKK